MRLTKQEMQYQASLAKAIESAKKLLKMVAWRTSSELTILEDERHKPVLQQPLLDKLDCEVAVAGSDTRIHFSHDFSQFQDDPLAVQALEQRYFDECLAQARGGKHLARMQLVDPSETEDHEERRDQIDSLKYYEEDRQQVEELLGEDVSEYVGRLVFSDVPENIHADDVAAQYEIVKSIPSYRYDRRSGLILAEIVGSVLDVSQPPYDDLFSQHPIRTARFHLSEPNTRSNAFLILCQCHPLSGSLTQLLCEGLLSHSG